ncbi:hypothetical protein [Luteococcus peritonei]|uniref:DUF2550 family protein n=1 Tax=Luteococcus peritonei TaxID=88874 RepID=A0ABW4RZS4_9ACTN
MSGTGELGILVLLLLCAGAFVFIAVVAAVLWFAWYRVRRSGLGQRRALVLRSATLSARRSSTESGEPVHHATFTFPDAPPLELRVPADVAELPLGRVGMLSSAGAHFESFAEIVPPAPPGDRTP